MTIKVRDISYHVSGRPLLSNVSFDVKANERVALMGPNGSGKSTLLRQICGLAQIQAGRVLLLDKPVSDFKRRELAQTLSFVQQKAHTDDSIQAFDAVSLGRTPWLNPFARWTNQHQQHVDDALRQVGMWEKRAQGWQTLSGGEQQRLHIARALAQDTSIIVMDEPTNHLDVRHQLVVLSLIKKIQSTLLVAVHDLNHALHFDRVIVMSHGQVVAQGKPSEVLVPDFIQDVFGINARVINDSEFPSHIQIIP
ncbi:ABC transporter ATP-binding protein [Marinomonas balearica]|uniref:Iron complex transport system ATP-binding protein n=1 Tax=Marinomonas balearica TaxID=491947 RepID=A0A4R6MF99_9GAMM|nr:ABC transporter ATP-binding protein [Marinomonas balearica]TDP00512.1 iron complex transport system ATP-binding protein [Marinomonas balearica]